MALGRGRHLTAARVALGTRVAFEGRWGGALATRGGVAKAPIFRGSCCAPAPLGLCFCVEVGNLRVARFAEMARWRREPLPQPLADLSGMSIRPAMRPSLVAHVGVVSLFIGSWRLRVAIVRAGLGPRTSPAWARRGRVVARVQLVHDHQPAAEIELGQLRQLRAPACTRGIVEQARIGP